MTHRDTFKERSLDELKSMLKQSHVMKWKMWNTYRHHIKWVIEIKSAMSIADIVTSVFKSITDNEDTENLSQGDRKYIPP